MKIIIAPYAGACSGVKKALRVTETALIQCRDNIYCLHDIVHNKQVMEKLYRMGLQKVESLEKLIAGDNLIINTHGTGPFTYQNAFSRGVNIIDTTCSNVRHVQKLAGDLANDNHQLIITGEKNHPEVKGILEWCHGYPIVTKDINDMLSLNIKADSKIALISQTTFSLSRFSEIAQHLKKYCPALKIYQTICRSTELRQKGILEIAGKVDTLWVIGSAHSANTTALLGIAQNYHPDSRLIEDADEINIDFLYGINTLGITAGASTPDWVINTVLKRISGLSKNYVGYTESLGKHSSF